MKISDNLYYQGHTYKNVGKRPCPIPGCEDGLIATKDENGVPAWWEDGCLFVLDKSQSVDIPIFYDWGNKVKVAGAK